MNHTINGGRDNADLTIRALEPWPSDSELLAWRATYTINGGATEHTAAVMVAAEDVTVPGEMVREAAREITDSAERADVLLVVAYAYAADAPPTVGRITVARAQMNRDLMIRELSAETGHEAFVIIGEPDIRVIDDYPNGQIAVEVRGYDTFDPATGNAADGGPDDVACWMVDTDHDGESFYARRIHFPGAKNDRQIKKLLKELGKNADDVEQEALTAMRSAPFNPPERGPHSREDCHRDRDGNDHRVPDARILGMTQQTRAEPNDSLSITTETVALASLEPGDLLHVTFPAPHVQVIHNESRNGIFNARLRNKITLTDDNEASKTFCLSPNRMVQRVTNPNIEVGPWQFVWGETSLDLTDDLVTWQREDALWYRTLSPMAVPFLKLWQALLNLPCRVYPLKLSGGFIGILVCIIAAAVTLALPDRPSILSSDQYPGGVYRRADLGSMEGEDSPQDR